MNTRTIIIAAAAGMLAAFAAPAGAHDSRLAVAVDLGAAYIHFVDGGHYYYAPRRYVHDRRYWRVFDRRHDRDFHRYARREHIRWHRYDDLRGYRYYEDGPRRYDRRYHKEAKRKHRRHHRKH
jgi:hypothetical protein